MMTHLRTRTLLLAALVLILVFGAGLTAGVLVDQRIAVANTQAVAVPNGIAENIREIVTAWQTIQDHYVDRPALDSTKLTYAALSGMVDALGDTEHSRFLTPQMVQAENNFTHGEFEGIGAEVETKNGQVVIVSPIDGSPAEKAGLKPGDAILKVNGEDVSGQTVDVVVGKILGPAGTQVTITLQDPTSHQTRDVTITRAKIKYANVTWIMIPGTKIAQLRLAGFSMNVTQEIVAALKEIQSQGAAGLILDLRNNPGGLLDEAVGVTSQFLKSGAVLQEKDASGAVRVTPVRPGGLATELPMVVLVNQGTASAAEIVTGALQDASRAKVIGETTFGTGTVLNGFGLPDQSELLLATEEWLTPRGRVIWHHGLVPDTQVALAAGASLLTPEIERSLTPDKIQSSADDQLLAALKVLEQPAAEIFIHP